MIAHASVEEVINRADIIEIVGLAVRLKKRGTNYIANCPFHNEKTPSFSVSSTKGIFKCFGCGRGGNVVTFVQEHEKLSFVEAIRWLADYYKIALEETERSPDQIQHQKIEESLRILNEFAAQYFHDQLSKNQEGRDIGASYFRQRGLRGETIDAFRLGYCPEQGEDFYRLARSQGYTDEILLKAGLIKERSGRLQDSYRGRVIFPIQGNTGRILGFGARILRSTDKAPKYVNTPENELYHKSRLLYGLYQARQAIGKLDECLLVEGYLDVISLHQAGIQNVVASSGTSLTEEQLRTIGHLSKNLTILYDGDSAGIRAALRGLDMALSQSFRVHLALLPPGEDPDSFVQAKGKSGFEEYIRANKRDVIGFRLEIGMKEAGDDPVKKNKLVNEVAESIARINKAEDFSLQQHYIRDASRLLEVDEGGLITLVNKYLRERLESEGRRFNRAAPDAPIPADEPVPESPQIRKQHMSAPQEFGLIRVLLEHGAKPYSDELSVAGFVESRVDPELIEEPVAKAMYDAYFSYLHAEGQPPALSFFSSHPDARFQQQVATLMHSRDEVSHNWKDSYGIDTFHGPDSYLADADSTLSYFELKKVKQMQLELSRRMKDEKDEDRLLRLTQLYLQFKNDEKEILSRAGTVIVRSE